MSKQEKPPVEEVFFNRELSWIEFNARVLDEGLQKEIPLLERLKFLAIVSSNYDEFFMVRVGSLKRHLDTKSNCPSGLSAQEQLKRISLRSRQLYDLQYGSLNREILPGLEKEGLSIIKTEQYNEEQKRFVLQHFQNEIFPLLSPIRIEKVNPVPRTGNLCLQLAFKLRPQENEKKAEDLFALLQIPEGLDRFVRLPCVENKYAFALIEDIVLHFAKDLFPGYDILDTAFFRLTRDADLSIDEERDEDFLEAMADLLIERRLSFPVRLEVQKNKKELEDLLSGIYKLRDDDIYHIDGPLNLKDFMSLCFLPDLDNLRDEVWKERSHPEISEDQSIWETLKQKDILLHHPYDSFKPVIQMLMDAAVDPNVLAIKMTLYRTSGDSPIIKALIKAAEKGKQVTVLMELKARFDEGRNIQWARKLEKVGAIVIYGIAHLKVHAKSLLIIRKEAEGIKKYIHLGTGNYNEKTAKLYTDMALLSSDDQLSYETTMFFNSITGYSTIPNVQKLSLAPVGLKKKIIRLIERESKISQSGGQGKILAKMNSLADADVIRALYKASQAGVEIKMNIRGICMLAPGINGLSENISVISIIDRYLEHTRMFYFENNGRPEVFLSSADWMPRNLERRVELLFPIEKKKNIKRIVEAFELYFSDTVKAHRLLENGSYQRLSPEEGSKAVRAQEVFYKKASQREGISHQQISFNVRKKPPAV